MFASAMSQGCAKLLPCRPVAVPTAVRNAPSRTSALQTRALPDRTAAHPTGSAPSVGRDETPVEALDRRRRESKRYEERVTFVHNAEEWEHYMQAAGNNLVVVEVQGESVCELGTETPEYYWRDEAAHAHMEAMRKCTEIKHAFQRVARDCGDATFLSITVDIETPSETTALCDRLGADVLPTLQFWRNGTKLWEHKGALHMDSDLANGVLFYEGSMADGVQAGDYVREISSRQELQEFINGGADNELKVVNMALSNASPCIHVYPAVLALAKNFVGFAAFARVLGDRTSETVSILRDHGIIEVPTFVFFRGGREVGRHIGSSRADLIGKILQIQQDLGISPPPRPSVGAVPRRKARPVWGSKR